MHAELRLETGTLYSFLLVLTRMSGAFLFVPLPGTKSGPDLARIIIAVFLTFALFPQWPAVRADTVDLPTMFGWLLAEAGLGTALGLMVGFLLEAFQMAAQIIGLQAGYSFASTIDPNSGADSTVLLSMAQLAAGILFFAAGLDRQVMLIFAQTLTTHPPGSLSISASVATQILRTGSIIFSAGFRLVLPLVALLAMIDISLALLARLNAQLQLITLAFPIKMLTSLALLASLLAIFPRILSQVAGQTIDLARRLL